jgi:hypothetical protein
MSERLYSQLTKAISITVILAVISPIVSIVPAQQRPTLRTDRQRYPPSEKVVVYFSGLPAGNDYQVTIVTPSHSDNAYGVWYPTEGKTEGVMEDFRSGGDGVYEVRIISLNPDSTRAVHARHIFTVGSAIYTPPAQPSPEKSPAPAVRPQVSSAEVLATGTPALTQRMVTELTEFLEWVLQITFSPSEREVIKASLLDSWQKNNREEIDGTVQVLDLARSLAQQSTAEREQGRMKLLPDFLTHFRNDKNDAASQMLVKAYDRQHPATVKADTQPGAKPQPSSPVTATTQVSSDQVKPMSLESTDDLAMKLAKQVVRGGSEAKPALVNAIQAAGFGIYVGEKIVVAPARPSQGASFTNFEVDAMSQHVLGTPLVELSYDLALIATAKKPSPQEIATFSDAVLETIRAAAADSRPTIRFWARFITELGRQSAISYDLLDKDLLIKVEARNIAFSSVQSPLLLRLVGSQLAWMASKEIETLPRAAAKNKPDLLKRTESYAAIRQISYTTFSYLVSPGGQQPFANLQGADISACAKLSPLESGKPDLDAGVIVALIKLIVKLSEERGVSLEELRNLEYAKNYWNQSQPEKEHIKRLEDAMKDKNDIWREKIKRIARAMNAAALILSLTELIITYNALEFEFQMEGGGPPLVRTKNPRPQPGGERRPISMKLRVELGDNVQLINCFRWLLNFMGIDFKLPNSGALPDVGVEWLIVEGGGLDWASRYQRKEEGSDEVVQWTAGFRPNQKTDAQGMSRVTIEGTAQRRYLTGKVLPVMKSATVRTNIQLKPADIFRDTGDALRGPWVVLAELIYRTRWFSSDFTFPVKDWEACEGGWNGTITYTESRQSIENPQATWNFTANIRVKQAMTESQVSTAIIEFNSKDTQRGNISPAGARITHEQTTEELSGVEQARVVVKLPNRNNHPEQGPNYEITVQFGFALHLKGTKTSLMMHEDRGPYKVVSKISRPVGSFSVQGAFDPNDPDKISGSAKAKYGSGMVSWDLRRCK